MNKNETKGHCKEYANKKHVDKKSSKLSFIIVDDIVEDSCMTPKKREAIKENREKVKEWKGLLRAKNNSDRR